MERVEDERYSDDQRSLGTSGRISLCHSSQGVKLQEKFKKERHSFTYGEIHDSPYKASRNHQKDALSGKITKKDEIVRYMSNLPCYLERGERFQEKVLSVGVLDWGRLEKWQYGHKQISSRSNGNPPVRNIGSSSSSSDSSSPHLGKDHISPHQRLHRPSLHSHMLASPHSQFVKSFGESDDKCQDHEFVHNTLNGRDKFIKSDQHSCKTDQGVKIKQSERKDSETKVLQECKTLPDALNYEDVSSQCGEFTGVEKSQALEDSVVYDHDVFEKPEAIVFLPRNLLKNSDIEVPKLSDSTFLSSQKSKEASQKSLKKSTVSFSVELKYEIPNLSKTLCEVDGNQFLPKHNCSINASNTPRSESSSTTAGHSPSKGRIFEAKTSFVAPLNSTVKEVKEASVGLDLKASAVAVDKARSSSPFSRLSIGIGRRRKSSSSIGNSCVSDQGSTHISVNSGSENDKTSPCLKNEKPISTSRANSSPLRRLLDPLLKPKAAIYHHAMEPLEKDLNDMADKAYNRQSDSSTVQLRKLKLDMSRCRQISVNDSVLDKKHGPSVLQALLQVAFKNGLPLFTFAVDNVSNILAATVKITSSQKEKGSHIYTFFTVQEVKRKTGSWINQGSKGKGRDYVSNVIAQMKVSESEISHFTRPDEPSMREFVLISVDLKQSDLQTSEYQPNEELAAIIVKIPPKIKQGAFTDEFKRNAYNTSPESGSRECFPKSYTCSMGSEQVQYPAGSESFISTTVILPSGVHSLPSKGGPSSLIERWNSGGSCDCGGWDLGCKLRVLANQNKIIEKSSSSQPSPITDQFKLFPQEGVPENHCVLSLATFKDMIYSVEFDSSLSLLQAFSICLAMIDSKNSWELSESSILFEAKTSGESKLMHNDRLWTPNLAEREVPAEHVTCPPLSPFGRV